MTSEQITNKQIKQFFDTYILGKKDVYFVITTGSLYDQKLEPYNPKIEDFSGEEKFLKTLEAVFDEDHYQIGIEVYEKAVKNIKADPFYHKSFKLKKEPVTTPNNGLNGMALGDFGGVEAILDTKLSAKYLSGENDRLKAENQKLEISNNDLTKQVASFTQEINTLKNEAQTNQWKLNSLKDDHKRAINNMEDDHKRSLDGINDRNDKFEKILTIGGIVAAKAAGLNETDLKGILGMDEGDSNVEKKEAPNSSAADINFEETKEYTGKKADAKKAIDNIHNILIGILDANNEEDAFRIIASFYNVVGFANVSIENLTKLNDIVVSGFNYQKEKTAAETIIEQANNYSNKDED